MKKIHIIGTGGLAKEIIGFIDSEDDNRFEIKGCWGPENFDAPEFKDYYKGSDLDLLKIYKQDEFILIAVTDPKLKTKIFNNFPLNKFKYINYIHPTALISKFSKIGIGCIIGPYAILTGNVHLEDFIYISYHSVVGHDTKIGSFSTLYPYVEVCGNCTVGEMCVFGINSFMLPGNKLISESKLDAGSILRESFNRKCLLSGNPATIIHNYD
tara:strand:+ start:89 stop:724 length:636 start_codon:yes stop_codon:yes gene_type:complete